MPVNFNPKLVELTEAELRLRLHGLELKHGMSSQDFLLRFNRGELGDDPEFIDWAGLLAAAVRLEMTPPARV